MSEGLWPRFVGVHVKSAGSTTPPIPRPQERAQGSVLAASTTASSRHAGRGREHPRPGTCLGKYVMHMTWDPLHGMLLAVRWCGMLARKSPQTRSLRPEPERVRRLGRRGGAAHPPRRGRRRADGRARSGRRHLARDGRAQQGRSLMRISSPRLSLTPRPLPPPGAPRRWRRLSR